MPVKHPLRHIKTGHGVGILTHESKGGRKVIHYRHRSINLHKDKDIVSDLASLRSKIRK